MIFLYWIKQKVTTGLRILFPEPKAKSKVTEEDMDKFLDKHEPVARSPKGKQRVDSESSTSPTERKMERLYAQNEDLQRTLDEMNARKPYERITELESDLEVVNGTIATARQEQTRLRGLIKDKGKEINELTNELAQANSTIDKYNAKTKVIMIRDEKAATLIKDQRNAIDDLTSKLQRVDEENKNLVIRIDTIARQALSKGISTDNEKIKELEGRLDKTTEYLARSKRNLDEKAEEINTLTSLNNRLVFELGQAREVNEDCDVEIEELKASNESLLMIKKENDNLKQRLAENETIRKELEIKLVNVQSSKDSSNTKAEESIIKEKDTEIKELKDANITLKEVVINLTSKLNTMTSLHTERSRNEELGRKKIIEINNDFTIREVKFVKEVVSKVYEYKEALGESAIIAESILINNSIALEHEKLYTANKLKEDLRNQRLFESEVNDSKTKLSQVYERIKVIDSELRETVKNINISNENYSEQINAIYTGMQEQKLVIENLVLTPIEKFIVNSPVSFLSKLSKANIVQSYTESSDLMANINRKAYNHSTGSTPESSPASSPMSSHTSTPSSSPRGEGKEKLIRKMIPKPSKEDSIVIKDAMSFLKTAEDKPRLKPMSTLSRESKTGISTKTKVTIPGDRVSKMSSIFKPSVGSFVENPTPNKEEKNPTTNTTNTTQDVLD